MTAPGIDELNEWVEELMEVRAHVRTAVEAVRRFLDLDHDDRARATFAIGPAELSELTLTEANLTATIKALHDEAARLAERRPNPGAPS